MNVCENDPLLLFPLFHDSEPVPVVVCAPWAKFHVTVPPTSTATVMGTKAKFLTVTDAVLGTDVGVGVRVAVGVAVGGDGGVDEEGT